MDEVLPGRLVEAPAGTFFLAQRRYPGGTCHGGTVLASARELSPRILGELAREGMPEGLRPEELLFLDTETTGLAGGTGTFVFLVGLGHFVGEEFHLHQFFMPGPQNEEAMLEALAERLAAFRGVVSFNGRAFDLPLLETRFVYSRRRPPLSGVAHLDLLFPARRLWRECVGSCSLASLEGGILGHTRSSEDIPGWLVPQIYFDYLRTGDARRLGGVFYHNEQDVLSLVALLSRMCQLLEDRPVGGGAASGPELYGLGRLYEERGRLAESVGNYRQALEAVLPQHLEELALRRLSFLLKRLGRLEEAASIWWRLADRTGSPLVFPYVELAKYYEHRRRDYAQAEALTLRAIRLVGSIPPMGEQKEQWLAELEHRLKRVRRKRAIPRA